MGETISKDLSKEEEIKGSFWNWIKLRKILKTQNWPIPSESNPISIFTSKQLKIINIFLRADKNFFLNVLLITKPYYSQTNFLGEIVISLKLSTNRGGLILNARGLVLKIT